MKSSSLNAVQTVCHKHNPNPEWAHIKYAYLNKTAIRFQFLFHHLSTADYTNEPVYVVVVSAGLLFFFASSWDFGLFFFFFGQSIYRARAFAHSLAGVQRVCMPRSIYMCSCDCVCLTALCCGVPGCYRRLRAYYSSAMHVWMCVCVCDSFEFSLCASISLCTIECLCTVSTHNICKLIGLLCLCSVLLCMCVYVVCIGSIGFFKNVEPAIRDLFVACLSYFASMCVPLNFIWYGVRRAFAIHRRHAKLGCFCVDAVWHVFVRVW